MLWEHLSLKVKKIYRKPVKLLRPKQETQEVKNHAIKAIKESNRLIKLQKPIKK